MEARYGERIDVLLTRLYYLEGLSQVEVAKKLRVPPGTLAHWMLRLGINQRAFAEQAAREKSA